jgi:L-ascorbate oxidase
MDKSIHCSCIHVLELELNDLVELIVIDEAFTHVSNHPMHLHGHSYAVIGMDKVIFEL